jgi:D-sedoheptulose 7-phosphate isomerase
MLSLQQYMTDYVGVLRRLDGPSIERLAETLVGAWLADRTVFLCGNGGSAATAVHLAADLAKLTAPSKGRRLRAVALTENLSAVSAIANDFSYAEVFAEQLRTFAQAGDVVVGLSTSGSSANVLRALEYASSIGAATIGITGRGGHKLVDAARVSLVIDSLSVQHIEDATMVAGHVLCLRLKEVLERVALHPPRRPVAPPALFPPLPVSTTGHS